MVDLNESPNDIPEEFDPAEENIRLAIEAMERSTPLQPDNYLGGFPFQNLLAEDTSLPADQRREFWTTVRTGSDLPTLKKLDLQLDLLFDKGETDESIAQ